MNYNIIKNLDGWGEQSTNNLKNSINNAKIVSLQRFIYSIGIRHIGLENAKIIGEHVKNISSLNRLIKEKQFDNFLNIDGIGETQINSLKKFFSNETNINIFNDLTSILKIEDEIKNKKGVLKNKTFMFTGKLDGISRAEAKSLIEKNSGTTVSNVSKNLNYLVVGEKSTKRKIDQANKIGVKIIFKDDLIKLLN